MGYAGTAAIALVVRLFGGRITSWRRDPITNERVGGSPTSKHLHGGAIDVGREFDGIGLKLASFMASNLNPWHDKGSAPHWHFEGGGKAVVVVGVVVVVAFFFARVLFKG